MIPLNVSDLRSLDFIINRFVWSYSRLMSWTPSQFVRTVLTSIYLASWLGNEVRHFNTLWELLLLVNVNWDTLVFLFVLLSYYPGIEILINKHNEMVSNWRTHYYIMFFSSQHTSVKSDKPKPNSYRWYHRKCSCKCIFFVRSYLSNRWVNNL